MKAILLVAGRGTRLQPLTYYIPKCCLPVAGVPLLHIWISTLQKAGVYELLLNPSWYADEVAECIFSFPLGPLRVTLRTEKEPVGTAQTLLRNADWIGEDDFFVIYGDVLTDLNLFLLAKTHTKKKALVTLATYETETPRQKGIVTVDKGGWATDFVEKPDKTDRNLAFSGIFAAKSDFIDATPSCLWWICSTFSRGLFNH